MKQFRRVVAGAAALLLAGFRGVMSFSIELRDLWWGDSSSSDGARR